MDFLTWSPFQDQKTRRICEHLTGEERARAMVYGLFGGLFLAFIFAVFVGLVLAYRRSILSFPACSAVFVVDLIVGLVGICHIRKRTKAFLASTAWAREERL
jgi:uncharacterized membrane protein